MKPGTPEPGELVAGRFAVESLVHAGSGEMVFQARDAESGLLVSLKVLGPIESPARRERFDRVVAALTSWPHPGMAAYVAHGLTLRREPFLATEWLEGETLAERWAERPLSVGESLALARRVGETLAVLHGHGLSHQGITPDKLLLREGRVELATLLDFGLCNENLAEHTITSSTQVMALLRYRAPEQARGEGQLGPAVDVYALGCVLFQCLTGVPVVADGPLAAVLAQILYEEALQLGPLRPDVPVALEALLGRMLAKQPGARLADGARVVAALDALALTPEQLALTPDMARAMARTAAEQRPICLLLARPPAGAAQIERAEIEHWLEPYAVQVEPGDDGTLRVTLSYPGLALGTSGWTMADEATQAVRAARALQKHVPTWSLALVTGLSLLPSGPEHQATLERAARLLELASGPGVEPSAGLWLDELTAGLLDTRFVVRAADDRAGAFVFERERAGLDEVRLLLGRATPYVGRTRELRVLELLFQGGLVEGEARGALVLGASGMGKSRLRQELVRHLTEHEPRLEVLLGRGDPLRTGTAGGLWTDALLGLCAVRDVHDPEERRRRFAARVGQYLEEAERQGVVEFLGELCGLAFPDEKSVALRAARQDPRLMSDRLTAALVSFLRSECAAHPVLLVLEDLHWSDAATLRLGEAAMIELAGAPLLVLALGRPELKEQFPRLWERSSVHEVHLGGLGREASERLVHEMLGAQATPEVCGRIVTQAGGNPLFLEELIRTVAEGMSGPSETLLAMLQARFLRLASEVRRILGVASVFGEVFWRGGLLALLGEGVRAGRDPEAQTETKTETKAETKPETKIDRWLGSLIAAEVVVRHGTSRYPGETEFGFRHDLLREAAEGLLGEEDRRLGHRLAAAYLERMGEQDPMVLAEHHERGGEREQAVRYLARGAAAAMEASDHEVALRSVERAVALGAVGEELGLLRMVEAGVHLWRWNFPGAYASGQAALELLPPGTSAWYRTLGWVISMDGVLGQREALLAHIRILLAATPRPGAEGEAIDPAQLAILQVASLGEREAVLSLLRQIEEICARLGESEARAQGLLWLGRAFHAVMLEGSPWRIRYAAEQGLRWLAPTGDRRYTLSLRAWLGLGHLFLGEPALARAELEGCVALTVRLGEAALEGVFMSVLAFIQAEAAAPEDTDALAAVQAQVEKLLAQPLPHFWNLLAHTALVRALLCRGAAEAAEAVARRAVEVLGPMKMCGVGARSLLCQALLAQGKVAAAVAAAEEGLELLRDVGGTCLFDVRLLRAAAEAYQAVGDGEAGRTHLDEARRLIDARAAEIPDPMQRERFLRISRSP